jgi:hypothetical protein
MSNIIAGKNALLPFQFLAVGFNISGATSEFTIPRIFYKIRPKPIVF